MQKPSREKYQSIKHVVTLELSIGPQDKPKSFLFQEPQYKDCITM